MWAVPALHGMLLPSCSIDNNTELRHTTVPSTGQDKTGALPTPLPQHVQLCHSALYCCSSCAAAMSQTLMLHSQIIEPGSNDGI